MLLKITEGIIKKNTLVPKHVQMGEKYIGTLMQKMTQKPL